jgi:hypothetical protein
MHRIGVAVWVAAALAIIPLAPHGAGAAGIYEDASAEPALLLAPQRITVRASLEIGSEPAEGSIYRLVAAFPFRSFLVTVDQPFVAVTEPDIETGLGDFRVRGRARLWGGSGRVVHLLGYLGTGTGEPRFFPYSSQTVDVNVSAGYADSLGAVTAWAIAGFTRVGSIPEDSVVAAACTNHARASAGLTVALGPGVSVGLGALVLVYENDLHRDLLFATGAYRWTDAMGVFVAAQAETGPVGDRVNDWGASVGVQVTF